MPFIRRAIHWVAQPFLRLEQRTYFNALVYRRKKAHNAKYAALQEAWSSNPTFETCRKIASELSAIDLRADPIGAIDAIESILDSAFFRSSKALIRAFEDEIERMIRFDDNLDLIVMLQVFANPPESLRVLLNRSTSSAEVDFERRAKNCLREIKEHVESMVKAYSALSDAAPKLRKLCKPGIFYRLLGFSGWIASQAGEAAASRSDSMIAAHAFEIGGDVLSDWIAKLQNSLAAKKTEEAFDVFASIAATFQNGCDNFGTYSIARFDPVFRAFMAFEKEQEDRFLEAVAEAVAQGCRLKPAYERVHGKLGY